MRMNDTILTSHIDTAVGDICLHLASSSPFLANEVQRWIRQISPGGNPAAHFLNVRMFPILQLPEFLLESISTAPDLEFQRSLTVSSVNGYYYVRLIDDVVDQDQDTKLELAILPVSGFFCSQFQLGYQKYFSPSSAFWPVFRQLWTASAAMSAEDASLRSIGVSEFDRVASRKYSAAGIPAAATCFYYDRTDLLNAWLQFVQGLGRWSQMVDDVFDWHQDCAFHRATYFLSEGERRKCPAESLEEWIMREGLTWGFDLLEQWMTQLQTSAARLGSPGLSNYLAGRKIWLQKQNSVFQNGFSALANLAELLNRAAPASVCD